MPLAKAMQMVKSGDTIATGGFVGIGFAEGEIFVFLLTKFEF